MSRNIFKRVKCGIYSIVLLKVHILVTNLEGLSVMLDPKTYCSIKMATSKYCLAYQCP